LLDRGKIASGRLYWQLFNTLVPVLLIIVAGIVVNIFRRRKYGVSSSGKDDV